MLLQRKTIVGNPKINYGLMEKKWILVCRGIKITVVKALVLKQNQFMTKEAGGIIR
jgi:hypothetical protein